VHLLRLISNNWVVEADASPAGRIFREEPPLGGSGGDGAGTGEEGVDPGGEVEFDAEELKVISGIGAKLGAVELTVVVAARFMSCGPLLVVVQRQREQWES
jgi:hypothetical protein